MKKPTKKEKAKKIQEILNSYFPYPIPTLVYKDQYTLLIATLLSAQCTDKRVNQVTPRLFKMADSPEKMVTLTIREIERTIRPCGLAPSKARAIWHLSDILLNSFDCKVPKTLEELETLPGVGRKTASVVLLQGFGKPAFPVDTHIHRLAKRWGLSSGTSVRATEEDLKKLFPKKEWARIHLQMIYFGRAFCPALRHKKEGCPICSILES